ncbi:hypothetical protein [Haloplanus pelagicus]|jgi:hypothetical protein|uniref:hypothetical protein n=1 Tax=Haloplanus pelagicus TaxID=2949995 RepID=UPI00203E278A|nr:hypothetical protein [Haloplanus sp. HW8-1]
MEVRSIFIGAAVALAFIYLTVTEPTKVSLVYRAVYTAIALTAIVTIGYGIADRVRSGPSPP